MFTDDFLIAHHYQMWTTEKCCGRCAFRINTSWKNIYRCKKIVALKAEDRLMRGVEGCDLFTARPPRQRGCGKR